MTNDVEIRLTADLDEATREVAGFRKEYAAMVQAVEKPLRQVDALQKTQQAAKSAAADFYAARQRVDLLRDALAKVRGPSDALAKSLGAAKTQADAAAGAVERQKKKIDDQRLAVDKARAAYTALKASMAGGGTSAASVAGAQRELAEQVDLLRRQQVALRDQRRELAATGRSVRELQAAYEQAVQPVRFIQQDLRGAERALSNTSAEFERQKQKVSEQRRELRAAGVDTRNLASEQQRLQAALQKAMAAGRYDIDLQGQTANFQHAIQQAAQAKMAEQQRHAAAIQGIRAQTAALQQQTNVQRQANIEAARNNLGINRFRALQAEIQKARQQYELLRRSGKLTAEELAVAQQQLTERIRESRDELESLGGEQGGGIGSLGGGLLARVGGALALTEFARSYIQITDEAKKMEAQLRLATESQEQFNTAQRETFRIAQENQAPLGDVVTLYGRLAPALRDAGRGQEDALKIIDAVTKSLRISGATAQETASTIQQFSQALGSGVLRGEEFNTLAEASPRLLRALADGLKVNVGALREMAAEGKLTADVIANALIGQLPKLTEEAAKLPDTFAGATTAFNNTLTLSIAKLDEFAGASDTAIASINRLSGAMQALSKAKAPSWLEKFGQFYQLANRPQVSEKAFSFLFFGFDQAEVKKTEAAVRSASATYKLQLEMLEMAEADSQIRRRVRMESAAAEREGLQFDEEEALRRHTAELGITYDEYISREKERQRLQEAGEKSHNENMKALRAEAVAEKEREIKAAEEQLKKANASLSKARDNELAIEKEFAQLVRDVRSGASGSPTLNNAYDARINARRALAAGDTAKAIEEARRAGEILKQLQAAGENDYGFAGIAEDLARIAGEAAKLESVNTEDEVEAVKSRLESLKREAEVLSVISVNVEWNESSAADILQKMKRLAAEIAQSFVFTPRFTMPVPGEADDQGYVYVPPNPTPPKFARGGILRGPGTATSDSILARLSNGEGILNARAVQHYGAGLVHQLNRLQLPRFATGGVMGGGLSLPAIPPLAPALQAQLNAEPLPNLGRMVLELGGGDYTVYATAEQANELKLAARKFGRPGRR